MMQGRFMILRKLLDGLYFSAAVLAAACLAAIGVLVLLQVVGRWLGIIVPSAGDFAGFLLAAATFLALACTQKRDGHIRVTLLIRNLRPNARRWQEILVLSFVLAIVARIAWACIVLVIESRNFNDVSGGYIAVPLWIPQLPMAAGLVIFTIALADELVSKVTSDE